MIGHVEHGKMNKEEGYVSLHDESMVIGRWSVAFTASLHNVNVFFLRTWACIMCTSISCFAIFLTPSAMALRMSGSDGQGLIVTLTRDVRSPTASFPRPSRSLYVVRQSPYVLGDILVSVRIKGRSSVPVSSRALFERR